MPGETVCGVNGAVVLEGQSTSPVAERFVTIYSLVTAPPFTLFNLLVLALILTTRPTTYSGSYARYIASLQAASTLFDVVFELGNLVVDIRSLLLYSCSGVLRFVSIDIRVKLIFFAFLNLIYVYFCCIFYRHQLAMPPSSKFKLSTTQSVALHLTSYIFLITPLPIVFPLLTTYSDEEIPVDFRWLLAKPAYVMYKHGVTASIFMCYLIFVIGTFIVLCVLVPFVHCLLTLRPGRFEYVSTRSRSLQRQLMKQLFLQIMLPLCTGGLPGIFLLLDLVSPGVFQGASVYVFPLTNLHAVLHSTLVLVQFPIYRAALVRRARLILRCGSRAPVSTQSISATQHVTMWASPTTVATAACFSQ